MDVQRAERLKKLPPYLFADLRRRTAEARERGIDVITLGIGDPDQPTPDVVLEELVRTVNDTEDINRHRYGCDVPVDALAEAIADFYKRRFGVTLGEEMICPTMGSKDAIPKLAMAVMNPGDVGIAPEPGYPTYNIGHTFASGVTHYLPLLRKNEFLPDFDAIPANVRRHAKLLWLNYPNNPTTAICDLDFYRRAVEFARENEILIANDLAYSENTYEGYRAPSILEVEGAADVAVELFSLSKAFNMTGWRVGCVVGNADAVAGLQLVKDNIDNGTLRAVQFAAAKALCAAEQITPALNAVYQRRRDLVVETLNGIGWELQKPKATIYIWAPVPEQFQGDSRSFAADLLEKTGVAVTPGLGYGEHGEGYFRVSLTYPDDVLKTAMGRLAERLSSSKGDA